MKKLLTFTSFALCFALVLFIGSVSANAQEISAQSCVLIEADSGAVVYNKNDEEERQMASTTKIMTTLIALEQDNLTEEFAVEKSALTEGSCMGLKEGDKVSLIDLCYGMMLPSGNDAANMTAIRIGGSVENFVNMMNEKAKALGLEHTHFVTPSGLDDDTDEHYSTALDMAYLAAAAVKNPAFREICSCQNKHIVTSNAEYWLKNTNKLLKLCDGAVGVKTGFTDKAGRCLVSMCERGGNAMICVTLSDRDDWNDHMALYDRYLPDVN